MSKIKCPECRTENPQTHKFCRECGCPLADLCRTCGHINRAHDKFCGECGENLGPTGGIKKSALKIENERKNVTVLFSDLTGYSGLTEKLDPEIVKKITNKIFSEISRIVGRYEGFVERVFGDEVLVYFGVPKSYENHATRAILAAREIHALVEALSIEFGEIAGRPLKMHTGIDTGLVVTGETDVRKGMDGFAGQAINIASRLAESAGPGEILVGPETYRVAQENFIFEALPFQSLKGLNEPIHIYRVINIRNKTTKFDIQFKPRLTPFIGRQRELELLLDYLEHSQESRSLAVSVVSRPGEGKSRLVYEFRKALTNQNVTVREGTCYSYYMSTAFYPVLAILKSYFNIREGDRDQKIREKLKRGLKTIGLDESMFIPYLHLIFSVDTAGPQKALPNPEEIKDRIVDVFKGFIIKDSRSQALIIAIEDLHWIDKSSEEVITDVIKLMPDTNVLFVFTYRTEYVPPWESAPFYYQITLNPLTYQESISIVNSLLNAGQIETELAHLLIEKTRGVPFFIEEFTRSLLDRKNIELKAGKYRLAGTVENMGVPSRIQDVVAARLDSLPRSAKVLLQKCAVAGQEFGHDVISFVSGLSAEALQTQLSILMASQLLFEKRLALQSKYFFRHSLTQEVAYDTMLVSKRKQIHERVGSAIEKLYHKNIDQFYELLAHHYGSSENREKAHKYLLLAGNKAVASYSNWDAFHFFKSAADLIDEMPEGNDSIRKKLHSLNLLQIPMFRLGYPEDSLRLMMEGARLSKQLKDEKSLAKFYDLIGNFYTVKGGDPLLGIKYSEKCLALAEMTQDFEITAKVARGLCGSYIVAGEPLKSLNLAEKVIAKLENETAPLDHHKEQSKIAPVFYALHAHSLGWLGNLNEGKQSAEKAVLLSRDNVNFYDLAYIHFLCGYLYMHMSNGKEVLAHFEKCIHYCEEGKVVIWLGLAYTGLGMGYFFDGNLKLAKKNVAKGLEIQEESQIPYYLSFHLLALGLVSYDLGSLNHARRYFGDALKFSEKYAEKWVEGLSKIYLGSTLGKTARYPFEQLETSILEGIRILGERKIAPWCSVGHYVLGQFYADNRLPEKAVKNLKIAERMLKEMEMNFWLSRTRKALQRL